MRHTLLLLSFFILINNCHSQLPLRNDTEKHVKARGFIYFFDENFLTFVPAKNGSDKLNYSGFTSDNLGTGFRLSKEGINFYVEDAKKYGGNYQALYLSKDSVILTMIPVEIDYILYPYNWNDEIMKNHTVWEKFKLSNKTVEIVSVGGMSLNIINIKPVSGFK